MVEEDLAEFPNVYDLLLVYDSSFFEGRLGSVELKWSKRMTLCAGVCSYKEGLVSIRLSEPLLKLRPVKDLKETLLHEMIHAYLMVTGRESGRDGHGDAFLALMWEINEQTGLDISVYHGFHDEVDFYRVHVWRCTGPCQFRAPYYGYVRRAMNRAPSCKDHWWPQHFESCGGTFVKVSEPPAKVEKRKRVTSQQVTKYFKPLPKGQLP